MTSKDRQLMTFRMTFKVASVYDIKVASVDVHATADDDSWRRTINVKMTSVDQVFLESKVAADDDLKLAQELIHNLR